MTKVSVPLRGYRIPNYMLTGVNDRKEDSFRPLTGL